jgi:methylmalonyl-CoA/ethylmalonyl-CoA epimerase
MSADLFQRLDHVGIVVNSLDEAIATYTRLGFGLLQRIAIPVHGVEAAFLDAGNSTVELIAPTDPTSGTARFLQNRGEGVHHLCYQVADIEAALTALRDQGFRLIDEMPRPGAHGLVAFVHPKAAHGTMIELLQVAEPH